MKYVIQYRERLGDVIRCLSIGHQLALKGHEVYLLCNPQYHSIFALCPLVRIAPLIFDPQEFKLLDLQIWPNRYADYRESNLPWWDYVTSLYPETSGLKWQSPFMSLAVRKRQEVLIAPRGYSQVPYIEPERVYDLARKIYPDRTIEEVNCPNLSQLVFRVAEAHDVITINTSIDFIADSVRESYHHVVNTGFSGQDDFFSPKQTRHKL